LGIWRSVDVSSLERFLKAAVYLALDVFNLSPNKSLHWPPDESVTYLVFATFAPDTGGK
jgi:hypothetical protein